MDNATFYALATVAAQVGAILTTLFLIARFIKPICRWIVRIKDKVVFLFKQQEAYNDLFLMVREIRDEVKPNSGGSMADAVNRIEGKVNYAIAARRAESNTDEVAQIETDMDGSLIWANRAFIKMVGRPFSDLQGSGWVNVIAPEEREWAEENWTHTVEERRVMDADHTYMDAEGQRFGVHVLANPIKGETGEFFGYLAEIKRTNA